MRGAKVDGQAIFFRLKRIQFALRIFNAATVVGLIALVVALREAFDSSRQSLVFIAALFFACALIALGALLYLRKSRYPNCNASLTWSWIQSDVLKNDEAGRCAGCGIRVNAPDLLCSRPA